MWILKLPDRGGKRYQFRLFLLAHYLHMFVLGYNPGTSHRCELSQNLQAVERVFYTDLSGSQATPDKRLSKIYIADSYHLQHLTSKMSLSFYPYKHRVSPVREGFIACLPGGTVRCRPLLFPFSGGFVNNIIRIQGQRWKNPFDCGLVRL